MASYRLGEDAVTQFEAGGIGNGGGFAETNSLSDETVTIGRTEIDVTTRNDEFETMAPGKKTLEVKGDLIFDPTDPFFEACFTAWNDRTPIGLKFQDDADSPTVTIQGDFNVYGGDWARPAKEGQKLSVSFKPARTDNPVTVTLDF